MLIKKSGFRPSDHLALNVTFVYDYDFEY